MAMAIFLPGGGVAFVVVAILDGPVTARSLCGAGFVFGAEAGEEEAGMGLFFLRVLLLCPLPHDGKRATCAGQANFDGGNRFNGGFAGVDAPVFALATQAKKGEFSSAREAPSRRLEVFSLVPMR